MGQRIIFKPKPKKIADAILYLALKGLELDQYRAVKFLYLADREHLRRFGRPVTFDRYVAMKYGPVASIAYDILRGQRVAGIRKSDIPFDIDELGTLRYVRNPKRDIDRSIFSKSDLIVLDEVADKFGQMTFPELYELTHKHFAYKRAWDNRQTDADPMAFEDFLDEDASKDDRVSDLEFVAKGM